MIGDCNDVNDTDYDNSSEWPNGRRASVQVFRPDLFPDSSGKEVCCPEGQVWSTVHPGPGTYWDCEPVNP